jgi:hypothetical protein
MVKRKRTELKYSIIYTEVPDAAARFARAFDLILANAARRRVESEGAPLNVSDEHLHEPDGGRHG